MDKAKHIIKLPTEEKVWLCFCFIGSLISTLLIYVLRDHKLKKLMGVSLGNRQLCSVVEEKQLKKSLKISKIMKKVSRNVPWPCKCLAQALITKHLCDYYGIPCVLYLGAKLDSNTKSGIKAHAWLTVGAKTIIGGHDSKKEFGVVGTFASAKF